MENSTPLHSGSFFCSAEIAELPDACLKKIHEFERELNREGFWNIALIAYQLKEEK